MWSSCTISGHELLQMAQHHKGFLKVLMIIFVDNENEEKAQ